MLINLQTCTIPYFKGNFIITDLFLYHGWTTVASAAARDENVSLLFFVTPSRKFVKLLGLLLIHCVFTKKTEGAKKGRKFVKIGTGKNRGSPEHCALQ